jgi:hypothetical protein
MASLIKVLIGFLIIGALYTLPLVHSISDSYTLSSFASPCEDPLISFIGISECRAYQIYFYLSWIVGITIIAWGFVKHD